MRVKLYWYDVVNWYDVVKFFVLGVFIFVGCYFLGSLDIKPQLWWILWSLLASFLSLGIVAFPLLKRKLTATEKEFQECTETQGTLKKGQAILLSEFYKEQLQELLNRYIVKVGECEASEMLSHDVSATKETLFMLIENIRARLKEMEITLRF